MSNAKALLHLRDQINKAAPNRSTANDGMLGDARHRRHKSDHNPNSAGVVTALDITHDPRHGVNSYAFAEYQRTHPEKRVQYIISNSRIWNPDIKDEWRPYNGENPHDMHVHISLKQKPSLWNNIADWDLGPIGKEHAPADAPERPIDVRLKKGDKGAQVREVQELLHIRVDGDFGSMTERAVKEFQRDNGMQADGIVGPYTWRELHKQVPPVPGPVPTGAFDISRITSIAAEHPITKYVWPQRGRAPIGYIKGVSLSFAMALMKLRAGYEPAMDMAKAESGRALDALTWYHSQFAGLRMDNRHDGPDTLRHLFVLLMGLGMRESSGKYCDGRDYSAYNTSGSSCEAGAWQLSWDGASTVPGMDRIVSDYSIGHDGFLSVYKEGVSCSASMLKNWGSGPGLTFQKLSKSCPDFAAMATALGMRRIRNHWGPLNTRAAEIRKEADDLLRKVQETLGV